MAARRARRATRTRTRRVRRMSRTRARRARRMGSGKKWFGVSALISVGELLLPP